MDQRRALRLGSNAGHGLVNESGSKHSRGRRDPHTGHSLRKFPRKGFLRDSTANLHSNPLKVKPAEKRRPHTASESPQRIRRRGTMRLLELKSTSVQLVVHALLSNQFIVASTFNNTAVVQNHNGVGVTDR